jgi:hypothetical protein
MSDLRIRGTEERVGARIDDVLFTGPDGLDGEAYLVRPTGSSAGNADAHAGIVMWHWLDSEAPDGNRTQYLDEAVELAAAGAVCLLPQGRFPWSAPPTGAVSYCGETDSTTNSRQNRPAAWAMLAR